MQLKSVDKDTMNKKSDIRTSKLDGKPVNTLLIHNQTQNTQTQYLDLTNLGTQTYYT